MDKFGPVPIDAIDFALPTSSWSNSARSAQRSSGPPRRVAADAHGHDPQRPQLRGATASGLQRVDTEGARYCRARASRRQAVEECCDDVPALKSAAPKTDRPRRSFLEARADRRGPARGGSDRGRASRAHLGEGGADPQLKPLRGVASARARRLRHADAQGPPRRALERESRSAATAMTCPRRVIVETLILAGPRVSELCGLDGPHLDLSWRSRTHPQVGHEDRRRRAQYSDRAGAAWAAERAPRADTPSGPGEPAFPTRNGTRQRPGQHPRADPCADPRSSERTARGRGPSADRAT